MEPVSGTPVRLARFHVSLLASLLGSEMIYLYITFGVIAWFGLGVIGLINDWLDSFDLTSCEIPTLIFCGFCMGPFSFLVWWFERRSRSGKKCTTLLKKKVRS